LAAGIETHFQKKKKRLKVNKIHKLYPNLCYKFGKFETEIYENFRFSIEI